MELTDEELNVVHSVLYDQYYYGEEYCYQNTDEARAVCAALEKIYAECRRRGFWWVK